MSATVRKKAVARKSPRKSASRTKSSAKKPIGKGAGAKASTTRKTVRRRPQPVGENVYHQGPLIDGEEALSAAIEQLFSRDPDVVGKLISRGGRPPLRRREPGFAGLVWIIVSQQVSTASANAIFKRVDTNLSPLSAVAILAADDAALRACGLSLSKMRALRALAEAIQRGALDLAGLAPLAAEEAHRTLVAIKGIGPWTADIFLLFCLGHPDAFPAGDLALQEATRLALGLKKRPDAKALYRIAERWRPLRSVAARLLWAYYRAARQGREGMALAGA
jgi:DNA-3-methyladenine glycosylase II